MKRMLGHVSVAAAVALLAAGCGTAGGGSGSGSSGGGGGAGTAGGTAGAQPTQADKLNLDVKADSLKGKTICFNYQALETEFWAAGKTAISEALSRAGAKVLEFNSNEDANRQFEQVKDCITQKADGLIFIPQDGSSANTVIKTANAANLPVVAFNRPPADNSGKAIVVVADNRGVAKQTVDYMVEEARKQVQANGGKKIKPLVMVGDLADINAVDRRKGYYDAVNGASDVFEKTVEVETKWDATTGQQNLQSAMQANPDVGMIFTSSDFLYPQIQAVLSPLGKWKPKGTEGHIILGGLDGDNRACNLMRNQYVDATGVQDLLFEAESSIKEITAAIDAGEKKPAKNVKDPGFALTLANMDQKQQDMWGCVIAPPK